MIEKLVKCLYALIRAENDREKLNVIRDIANLINNEYLGLAISEIEEVQNLLRDTSTLETDSLVQLAD